ncbi:AraC family transcriptional regulator [Dactylosporangium roseum]|uniref:AraC family transcriptional regulator n=1 Tax=Dactylosporangium roseum TaxID=47989 RepID=A0ABY5ZDA6_9ACTN|nr:AraC family transcriptional regulator [Dactylosporangium roseum]UWZ40016.1 AraC family transcriptional regulator [Dactylosporangium roseum]
MDDVAQRLSERVWGVEEARALCHTYFYPVTLEPLKTEARLSCTFDALVAGPVTLADLEYGAAIRMSQPNLETAYHVNVPLFGALQSVYRGVQIRADSHLGAVFGPKGEVLLERWNAGTRVMCVKLDRLALHAELESLLGRPVRGPLELAPSLDVSRGAGLTWLRLMRLLADDIHNEDGLLSRPAFAERLGREAVRGLLYAVGHRYLAELAEPGVPCLPRTVRRAVDAIRDDPARSFTVAELAAVAGVSVRALQEGFRRHVGVPPLVMLREARMARVHEELRAADPYGCTVAEVAHRWGFAHLGRFAAAYRRTFGEPPSATLHRG